MREGGDRNKHECTVTVRAKRKREERADRRRDQGRRKASHSILTHTHLQSKGSEL